MYHPLCCRSGDDVIIDCWWRPDNCDMITWIVISNSLDIVFIQGNIHDRSCKKGIFKYHLYHITSNIYIYVILSFYSPSLFCRQNIAFRARIDCVFLGNWWHLKILKAICTAMPWQTHSAGEMNGPRAGFEGILSTEKHTWHWATLLR